MPAELDLLPLAELCVQLALKALRVGQERVDLGGDVIAWSCRRTQLLDAPLQAGAVLGVTYEKIKELYFQNPSFGFYFLQLTTSRLFENNNRLEGLLAEREIEVERLRREAAE